MYEFFEHTADLGLRVRAADRETLYRDAARGLFAMIAEPEPTGDPAERLRFDIPGVRDDLLLFDWLAELLYTFESRRVVLGRFAVAFDARGLTGSAGGYPLAGGAWRLLREVKAITYHGLRVERGDSGWLAELIVDI